MDIYIYDPTSTNKIKNISNSPHKFLTLLYADNFEIEDLPSTTTL